MTTATLLAGFSIAPIETGDRRNTGLAENMNWQKAEQTTPVDSMPPAMLPGPSMRSPDWQQRVLRRIWDSVPANPDLESSSSGQWISSGVAAGAALLLNVGASLLPNEPYIFATAQGDLAIEFRGDRSRLTAIVSSDSVLFVSSKNGKTAHATLPLIDLTGATVKRELVRISES